MDMTIRAEPLGRNVIEAILARRSVRSYSPDKLGHSTVSTLLEAAVRAPTAMQEEPWAFVVIQDAQVLKQLSDRAKPIFVEEVRHRNTQGNRHSFEHFDKPDFDIFHGAGTLIVICAKPAGLFVVADCWLAAENLMLAACDMGLGSCVIGSSTSVLNIRKVKAELGIPDEYSAIAPIIVGVPSVEPEPVPRKEPVILAWKQ
ncbi:MAG: nitroreductase family protein [Sideroxyarcus sp.]|nr:nitroreductase family protein [Sideroxyarcus sp.]